MFKLLRFAFLLALLSCAYRLEAQTVRLLTLDALEQRMDKGKDTLYVVNFWASWCAPCLAELPHFEELGRVFKGQKVKVLLLSLDFKSKLKSDVEPLVKRMKLNQEVYLLDEKSQQAYIERIDKSWSGALPATLFVSRAKGTRQFFEQEFSLEELKKTYQLNKQL